MPIVKISTGFLKGTVKKDINGKDFHSFEGIRYGEPPVGELRFQAPVPTKPWLGVKEAFSQGPRCYSGKVVMNKTTKKIQFEIGGSEDCLFLNVFTPKLPHDQYDQKPVIVFIHGGAFLMGSTHAYGPEVLVTEDIVLVTIQYRLGALGFLAIDGVTGNAALKDILLALKWVQQNIKAFNGDPENVTLLGQSAGGYCVHHMLLTPLAKGLFHRAIILNGALLCPLGRGDPNNGIELAKHLGYTATHENNVLKFLQEMPVEDLFKAQNSLPQPRMLQVSTLQSFAPVIERSDTEEAFITDDPRDAIYSGHYNHVPLIFGYCKDEAYIFLNVRDLNNLVNDKTDTFSSIAKENIVPWFLNLEPSSDEYDEVAEKIRKFYDVGDKNDNSDEAIRLASDNCFIRGVIQSAEWHSKTTDEPVYLCRLSVATKLSNHGNKCDKVNHEDIMSYLFKNSTTPEVEPASLEDLTRRRLLKLLTNFARTGNPNPAKKSFLLPKSWKPVKNGEIELLDIGTTLTSRPTPEKKRMVFWDELFQAYPQANMY